MKKTTNATVNTTETTPEEINVAVMTPAEKSAIFAELLEKVTTPTVEIIQTVKEQRATILNEAASTTDFADFCNYMKSVNYAVTLNKKVLLEVGKMPEADYVKLSNTLTNFRYALTKYTDERLKLQAAGKKASRDNFVKAENMCFMLLKHIKGIFDITTKCNGEDINLLAGKCITVKYIDRNNIKAGYTLNNCGNITLLNHFFKLMSAFNNSNCANVLENMERRKVTANAIAASISEITK